MKYKISLNGKDYIVEVERGEALMVDVQDTPPAAPVSAPAPASASVPPVTATAAPPPAAPTAPSTGVPLPAGAEAIKAPMSGLILRLSVDAGDSIKEGDLVCILEAMKMENEIYAPRDGKVIRVEVGANTQVETGQPLVYLE